jgi:hypothetical protein
MVTDKIIDYQYMISIDGDSKTVDRTTKPSAITKSISGEKVSSYNSFLKELTKAVSSIRITNTSEYDLLFKIFGNNTLTNLQPIDYIRYSPHKFNSRVNLEIDEKTYTYFSANPRPIEFNLEGPIYLKIISRLLFDDTINSSYEYRYILLIDDVEYSEYREKAHKSLKALLKNEEEIIPSTGDVNIVKIPDGSHKISIVAPDINRDIIFRLFISKSAVEMSL